MNEVTFSPATKQAIIEAAHYFAGDLETTFMHDPRSSDVSFSEILAEVVLDTNRLQMIGYADADKEVGKLFDEHGWTKVKEAAAKFIPVP